MKCKFQNEWRNSRVIRLPASAAEVFNLKEGGAIEIPMVGSRDIESMKMPEVRKILAHPGKHRGGMLKDFKFDRIDAHDRS